MPNVTWTRDLAAHLLRRAGFGSTRAELDELEALGLDAAVDRLVHYETVSNADLDARLAQFDFDFTRANDVRAWWVMRMLYTARPLEEKMVFFWHDHFATSVAKVQAEQMKAQLDTFRLLALGNFEDMLVAVSRDPAMLDWLDNRLNRVGRPNENYAREVMELFSLGEGNGYTEDDIKEVARAFTGWTTRNDAYAFVPGAHDTGAKTFLGVTVAAGGGESDGLRVCETLAGHPSCGPFLVRKLWEFFVYPNPSDAVVAKFADVYYGSGYDIREVMRAIFRSDEFYSEKALFGVVKSPTEFTVGALKALDAEVDSRNFGNETAVMGQILLAPPDVAGWDGGLTWINTTTLLARANFANVVATDRNPDDNRGYYVDLDAVLAGRTFTKAKKLVDFMLDVLGPLPLAKKQKKPLKDYLLVDDAGVKHVEFALDATTKDKKLRGLIHLIMTLPEYQLN
jgi:uncharacterized protein (DUF1800 family)